MEVPRPLQWGQFLWLWVFILVVFDWRIKFQLVIGWCSWLCSLCSLWLLHWECLTQWSGFQGRVLLGDLAWLLDESAFDLPCGCWNVGSFLLQSLEVGASLTWNCGNTSPISRLSMRETSQACCGECPRYMPTRKCNFHLWWMAVSNWRSWTNMYARHPNECQSLGLLATLVLVKDSMGIQASLNLRLGMTLIVLLTTLSAHSQRFGVMALGHL